MDKFINNEFESLLAIAAGLIIAILIFNLLHGLGALFIHLRNKRKQKVVFQEKSESEVREEKPKSSKYKVLPKKVLNKLKKVANPLIDYSFYYVNVILVIALVIVVYFLSYPEPKVIASNPAQGGLWEDPEKPIEVEFSRPVNVGDLELKLGPEMEGEWKRVEVIEGAGLVKRMRFYPKTTVMPGQEVSIYVVGFNPRDIGEHLIEFKTPDLPEVTNTNVNPEVRVDVDSNIEFDLSTISTSAIEWRVEAEPHIDGIIESEGIEKVRFMPEKRLGQNKEYKVKLYRKAVSYKIGTEEIVDSTDEVLVKELSFKTDDSPLVKSVEPSGEGVLANSKIRIVLDNPIDKVHFESKFRLEPAVQGTIVWEDDLTIVYTPTAELTKEMLYKIILERGLEYKSGTFTKEDTIFEFTTIGAVKVNTFSPVNGATRVSPAATISITFDQEVDKASAQSKLVVSPAVSGAFSWKDNTMYYNPSGSLGYSKTYTATVKAGVKTVHGQDSNRDFSTKFTTQPEVVSLSVPYYRQVRRFECQLLATRMVLAYRGVYMTADQIMYEIGVDSTPWNSSANTWGDPNVRYVGDVTGSSKGYGVYVDPLSRVAQNHGRGTRIYRGWNVSGIAKEVEKGNPVIVQSQNNWSTPTNISWRTPGGKYIHAINGTHAYVVVGFKGSSDSPTSILVQDPWYRGGSRRYMSLGEFNRLWGYHGNTALVIY